MEMAVSVSVRDTDAFRSMVKVLSALLDDENTPDWIKEKIRLELEVGLDGRLE